MVYKGLKARWTTGLALAALAVLPSSVMAVPAWARKYEMPCTSCHFGGSNKLTKFGTMFQLRGFRTADEETMTAPSQLSLANYLSFAGKFRYIAEENKDPSTHFDIEALSIYSGGPLYDKYSYFFEFYLHEPGKITSSTGGQLDSATRSKLAEMYLMYNTNPNGDDFIVARAGQITPRLIYAASTGGRLGISRPLTWNDNVGGGNFYTPRDRFYGLSVATKTGSGFVAEAGIVNGGGGNARPTQPENNNARDLFATATQYLDDDGSFVGAYGYSGVYPVTGTTPFEDKFSRFALVGELVRENFVVSGAYSWGRNKLAAGGHRNPTSHYLEAGFNASPEDTIFARYDSFDSDMAAAKTGLTLGFTHRLSSVGRLAMEGQETRVRGGSTSRKLVFELNWMF